MIYNHSWRFSPRWNLADPKCGFDFRSFLDQLLCRQLPVIWRCNYIVIYVILVAFDTVTSLYTFKGPPHVTYDKVLGPTVIGSEVLSSM